MKEKRYTGVKVGSFNGKYIRLITQPLSEDELGLPVVVLLNKEHCNEHIAGTVKSADDNGVMLVTWDNLLMVVNPKVIVGWTIPRMFLDDMENKQLQQHPEQFCVPGTFSEEGVRV